MNATVADLNPKTLDSAKRQFVELYGSALVLNTYLKIALVLVSLVALGLLHVAFLVRLVRARGAAARQRAVELESYRAIRSEHPPAKA